MTTVSTWRDGDWRGNHQKWQFNSKIDGQRGWYCWWKKSIRRSPVEVGSLSTTIYRVLYIPGGFAGFLNHQQQDLSTICPWSSWSSYGKSIRTNSFTASPGELKTAHSKLTQLTRRHCVFFFTPKKKSKGQMQDLLTWNLWFQNCWTLQIDRLTKKHPMWSYSVLSTIQFIGIQDVLFSLLFNQNDRRNARKSHDVWEK